VCKFSGVKYIHIPVQPAFSISQLKSHPHISTSGILLSVSVNLTALLSCVVYKALYWGSHLQTLVVKWILRFQVWHFNGCVWGFAWVRGRLKAQLISQIWVYRNHYCPFTQKRLMGAVPWYKAGLFSYLLLPILLMSQLMPGNSISHCWLAKWDSSS
jgi:hypothetical protein